jgi:hypothetical protein
MWWIIGYIVVGIIFYILKCVWGFKTAVVLTSAGEDVIKDEAFYWALFWPISLPFTVLTTITNLIIRVLT